MRRLGAGLLAVAAAACGKSGGDPDTRPRRGVEVARVEAPDAGARGADTLSIDPDKAFEDVGCERRYPSAGTRFVEETDFERIAPPGYVTAYHDMGSEHVKMRRAVTLHEVSGAQVLRASIVEQTWFLERGAPEERGAASTHDLFVGDGGKVMKDRHGDITDFTDDYDKSLVGPEGFGVLLARGSVPALERAVLQLELGLPSPGGDARALHLSNRRHEGAFDKFDVDASWTENGAGMSQWTVREFETKGTLVLRAADGAFVDLTLTGTAKTQSGVSPFVVGPGQPTAGPTQIVKVRTRRSRPCFRAAVDG